MLFDLPLRTKQLLEDARKLERRKFYVSSILLYSHYLEQILLVATLSYYDLRDSRKTQMLIDYIFDVKDEGRLTFGKILSLVPKEILDKETIRLCNEVKNVRNILAAHYFFVIQLDKKYKKMRAIEDVNNYRKFIRRIYKLIRKDYWVEEAEYFLKVGHPTSRYRTLEEDALSAEKTLLRLICKKTREDVKNATRRIDLLSGPLSKYMI